MSEQRVSDEELASHIKSWRSRKYANDWHDYRIALDLRDARTENARLREALRYASNAEKDDDICLCRHGVNSEGVHSSGCRRIRAALGDNDA